MKIQSNTTKNKPVIIHSAIKVNLDIEREVAALLKEELCKGGYSVSDDMGTRDLFIAYFGLRTRMVSKRKRKVWLASDFDCPPHLQKGFEFLKSKIEAGDDLRGHLSRKLKDLEEEDFLLFDWNIRHFHLGEIVDADGFVKRTKELLFAMVDEDNVYCIKIAPHGGWSDKELLETVHKNWPLLLNSWKVNATPEVNFTSGEIAELRKGHVNVIVQLNDGTCYVSPGFGIMTSGVSARAVLETMGIQRMLDNMKSYLGKAELAAAIKEQMNVQDNLWDYEIGRDNSLFYAREKKYGFRVPLFQMDELF